MLNLKVQYISEWLGVAGYASDKRLELTSNPCPEGWHVKNIPEKREKGEKEK